MGRIAAAVRRARLGQGRCRWPEDPQTLLGIAAWWLRARGTRRSGARSTWLEAAHASGLRWSRSCEASATREAAARCAEREVGVPRRAAGRG